VIALTGLLAVDWHRGGFPWRHRRRGCRGDESMRQRRWWDLVALPVAHSTTHEIGLGFKWVGCGDSEPRDLSPDSYLPFICVARQGPTNHVIGLGVPNQDTRSRYKHDRWAKSGGDLTWVAPCCRACGLAECSVQQSTSKFEKKKDISFLSSLYSHAQSCPLIYSCSPLVYIFFFHDRVAVGVNKLRPCW